MFTKLKKIHDSIDVSDLNTFFLLLSVFCFLASLCFTTNIFLLSFLFLWIFFQASYLSKNKCLRFLNDILGILFISYILIYFLNLSVFSINIRKIGRMIIKGFLCLDYFLFVFLNIKNKKIRVLKKQKKNRKKYTFKELRISKKKEFLDNNKRLLDNFTLEMGISVDSDYYKLLKENLENKSNIDLEECVWLHYLRFYKNKGLIQPKTFDKMNFVFITIHVIILLLAIIVR